MACIFCSIADGDAPSRTVYADQETVAFLDTNPLCPGHTLVIPKQHYERLNDMPNDTASSLMQTLTGLLDPIESAVGASATTIAFNNGRAAGQEVPHVHGHLIPRSADDTGGPIHAAFRDRPTLSADELDRLHDRIRTEITDTPS